MAATFQRFLCRHLRVLLAGLLSTAFTGELALAASLNVSPGSGAAGREVTLTSSGFDLDGIGYNTAFFVVVNGVTTASLGSCPAESRANCSFDVNLPGGPPGTLTIEARNSIGETASDTYNVAKPEFTYSPMCAAPGDTVTASGRFFGVGAAAGIYFDGMLIPGSAGNYPNELGQFTFSFEVPTAAPGQHEVKVQNSYGTIATRNLYYEIPCAIVGEVTDLRGNGLRLVGPGGAETPLALGSPLRRNDHVIAPAGGGGTLKLTDNSAWTFSGPGGMRLDDDILEPPSQGQPTSGPSFFSLLEGVFVKSPPDWDYDPDAAAHANLNTAYGNIGVRGTAFRGRFDPGAPVNELYLTEGRVEITPWGTGETTVHDAPVAIYFNDSTVTTGPIPDADGDGVADAVDSCLNVANASQCDSDGDGFGNRCDGDLNNNGATNAQDTGLFRAQLGQPSPATGRNKADLNCNGAVNAQDTGLFRQLLGAPPGPSGLAP